MKRVWIALAVLMCGLPAASAEECRRVIAPTIIAVVAHGDIFVRKADRGMTFRADACKTRIGEGVYCRIARYRQPAVYLKHADAEGREYTAFWGKDCK